MEHAEVGRTSTSRYQAEKTTGTERTEGTEWTKGTDTTETATKIGKGEETGTSAVAAGTGTDDERAAAGMFAINFFISCLVSHKRK